MAHLERCVQQLFTLLLVLAAIASVAQAQGGGIGNTTSTPVAGVPHDYITGLNETVNPANGALSVRIGQPVPPERGHNWPAYAFIYDSNSQFQLQPLWSTGDPTFASLYQLTYNSSCAAGGAGCGAGTNLLGRAVSTVSQLMVCQQTGQYTCTDWGCNVYAGYTFTDKDGGQHGLGLQRGVPTTTNTSNDCQFFSINNFYYGGDEQYKASMDTSGNVTVIDTHGNQPLVEDANGNYRDTAHRTAPVPALATIQSETIPLSQTYNVLNNSQDGNACLEPSIPGLTSMGATKSVTLPNGQKYSFQYDPVLGLMNKITYPTGASVTYTWSVIPNAEGVQYANNLGRVCSLQHDWFAITKRVVSYDGVTNAEEQDFAYTTVWPNAQSYRWTSKTTTVTTKDLIRGTNFRTVYSYLPTLPPAESDRPMEDLGYVPQESTIQYYDTNGSLLKTTTKVWLTSQLLAAECETLPNGLISGKFTSYRSYSGFAGLSPQPFNGDALLTDLPTDVAEYDYGQVSSACTQPSSSVIPIRETVTTYQAFGNSPLFAYNSIQDRPSSVQVYGNVGGTKTLLQETDYVYDGTAASAVTPTPYGHDETNFGSGSTAPRGNPTTVTHKCFAGSCTNTVTTYTYDTTGQVLSITDPCGNGTCSDMSGSSHTTTYSYADSYTTDDGSPPQNTNAYVTRITKPATNGVTHITQFQYGFEDGKLRNTTDENGQVTTFCYWTNGCAGSTFDPFVRLTGVEDPDLGSSTYTYSDAGPSPSVTTTTAITSVVNMVSTTSYDAIGHPVQTALSSDPDGTSYTATTYDGMEKPYKVYNPTRCNPPTTNCGSETTWGITTYTYDALGRTTNVAEPDGSQTQTSYSSNQNTVTDEAGNQRTSQTDALGRLTSVWEAPNSTGYNFQTQYQYDALGNLICAVQKGTDTTAFTTCAAAPATWRPRAFVYDSLSRLTTSTNPESGTITYSYDLNGNPSSKVAPQPNQTNSSVYETTNYSYDVLNRLTQKSYVGVSTPAAMYWYDGTTTFTGCSNTPPALTDSNPKPRRTAMCDGSGATSWIHDSMGRALTERRFIPGGGTRSVMYTYTLDGSPATVVYPSTGKTITYTYSAANRVLSAKDTGGNINYVQNATYAPPGELSAMTNGSGIHVQNSYNSRLQPLQVFRTTGAVLNSTQLAMTTCPGITGSIMHFVYGFGAGTNDNGNPQTLANCRDTNRTQNFTYDPVNRIQNASTNGPNWGESYTIDAWGNMTAIGSYQSKPHESLSTSATTNNRLAAFSYDAAGNVTLNGSTSYTYDGENRISNTSGWVYTYDGDGKRVKKCASSCTTGTLYWTGIGSDALSESDLSGNMQKEYIFLNGARVARRDVSGNTVHYYFSNQIGSASVVTNSTGSTPFDQEVDYYPYGGEIDISNNVPQNYKFTGKERDSESGLDEFGARYFASSMGRFMTPDWAARPISVPYAVFGDPQSLNLYGYVRNDPVSRADADGHCGPGITQGTDQEGPCDPKANQKVTHNKTVTVTVDQVKGTAGNPFGHITVKVDGGKAVGLVPNSDKAAAKALAKEAASAVAQNGVPTPSSVPGHIEQLAPNRLIEGTATIEVTPDQARAMQTTINEAEAHPQGYDPAFRNCTSFVEQVLHSGGVNAPNDMTPGGLVEDLNQQNSH